MDKLRYTSHAKKYFKKLKEKGLIKEYNEALDAIECDPYTAIILQVHTPTPVMA